MDNELIKDLREGLNHLYDLDFLRRSPLDAHLGLAGGQHSNLEVQQALEQSILALKPGGTEMLTSPRRRAYELLFNRYIQQFSQKEVADQLGVSLRQYRREQELAIEILASQLLQHAPGRAASGIEAAPAPGQDQADLAWLAQPYAESPNPPYKVVQDVQALVERLAARRRVRCESHLPEGLPALKAHQVALRQVLLNLLSAAIYRLDEGKLLLDADLQANWIEFRLRAEGVFSRPIPDESAKCMNMALYLAGLIESKLSVHETHQELLYSLKMPVQEKIIVLVVDDSTDNIRLLQRYVSETRYILASTRDPHQCLAMAESLGARIIVLDVMMPPIDGWEVLSRLKNHPSTATIPVIICTILPHKELALTLGANDFLPKPVTREQFLAALDRLSMEQASTHR